MHTQHNSIINHITTKGIVVSCIFIIIQIIVIYADQYLNLLQTKDKNGFPSYIEGPDVLFLCLQTPLLMFITYFTQKESIWKDLPTKHLLLIIFNQIIALIQTCLHYVSLWTLGIIVKSLMNALSIIFVCVSEKLLFKKKLFKPDYLGIIFLIVSIVWLFPFKLANNTQTQVMTIQNRDYFIGITAEFVNCLCSTFTNIMAEYVCKVDYVSEMNKHFDTKWNQKSAMKTPFWLGVNGIIALPLCVLLIVILSFIPLNDTCTVIDFADFCVKLMSNKLLLIVFMISTVMLYLKSYVTTEVQIHVSSVAKKLLKSFSMIPVWFINIFIATNPRKGGTYLDSFDPSLWNEWCLIISFIFSVIGVLVYYEFGVPKKHRRAHKCMLHLADNDHNRHISVTTDSQDLDNNTKVTEKYGQK